MSELVCVACRRQIDAAAKLCPYCGADPRTGEKIDTQAMLQEVFHPRAESTAAESVLEYARQRQGIVIMLSIIVTIVLLAGLMKYLNRRNATELSNAAVPLTEVVDVRDQQDETKPQPMPDLQFQYDGNPQTMRTFVTEAGAVAPPAPATTTGTLAPPATAASAPPARR